MRHHLFLFTFKTGQNQELCNNVAAPSCRQSNQVHSNDLPCDAKGRAQSLQGTHNLHNGRSSPKPWQVKSPSKYEITTPYERLPACVIVIMRRFDVQNSLVKIEDLGDALGKVFI